MFVFLHPQRHFANLPDFTRAGAKSRYCPPRPKADWGYSTAGHLTVKVG